MLDLTKLPIGTRLRTRAGRSARLLANDVKGIEPCLIAVKVGRGMEQIHNVGPGGWVSDPPDGHPHDIVGIEWPKRRLRVRVLKRNGSYAARADSELEPDASIEIVGTVWDQIVEIEERDNA